MSGSRSGRGRGGGGGRGSTRYNFRHRGNNATSQPQNNNNVHQNQIVNHQNNNNNAQPNNNNNNGNNAGVIVAGVGGVNGAVPNIGVVVVPQPQPPNPQPQQGALNVVPNNNGGGGVVIGGVAAAAGGGGGGGGGGGAAAAPQLGLGWKTTVLALVKRAIRHFKQRINDPDPNNRAYELFHIDGDHRSLTAQRAAGVIKCLRQAKLNLENHTKQYMLFECTERDYFYKYEYRVSC